MVCQPTEKNAIVGRFEWMRRFPREAAWRSISTIEALALV
jgi:hypothetical protein